jgi:hypothetical protein
MKELHKVRLASSLGITVMDQALVESWLEHAATIYLLCFRNHIGSTNKYIELLPF